MASVVQVHTDLGSNVIQGYFRGLKEWGQMSIFKYLEKQAASSDHRLSNVTYAMDSRNMINLTQKDKVYSLKVNFSIRSCGVEI